MARPSGLAYSIHTPRLILRCWYPTDATLLQREINENLDYLRPWVDWARQEPESLEMKTERLRRFRDDFLSRREFVYGIFGADGVRIIGGTGLHTRGEQGRAGDRLLDQPALRQQGPGYRIDGRADAGGFRVESRGADRDSLRPAQRGEPPGWRRSSDSPTVRHFTATRAMRRGTCEIPWCGVWTPPTIRAAARRPRPWPPYNRSKIKIL